MKTFDTVHKMTTALSQENEGLHLPVAATPPVWTTHAQEWVRQAESDTEINLPLLYSVVKNGHLVK